MTPLNDLPQTINPNFWFPLAFPVVYFRHRYSLQRTKNISPKLPQTDTPFPHIILTAHLHNNIHIQRYPTHLHHQWQNTDPQILNPYASLKIEHQDDFLDTRIPNFQRESNGHAVRTDVRDIFTQ
ncbi:hypothetical protein PTT_00727 [Pyrenophora teres f. teres 0-1]|uniref:Uncharacterized protein n=1 Tax=Pyrenophora teres f. teres (strain 0-1) TaxID=861557 RepID=E3RCN3_PYRTT|nr:hypothetical protein PTT_00727 [Pyrenophora teres f. teres 0-1]